MCLKFFAYLTPYPLKGGIEKFILKIISNRNNLVTQNCLNRTETYFI